jgi:hypothetical protein
MGVGDTEPDDEVPFNLDSFEVPLRDWVQQDTTRAEIKRRFVRDECSALSSQARSIEHHEALLRACCFASRCVRALPLTSAHLHCASMPCAVWCGAVLGGACARVRVPAYFSTNLYGRRGAQRVRAHY